MLIKPQFEAGKSEAARGRGVIRDAKVHESVLNDILSFAENAGYQALGVIKSPILGPKGNREFLTRLRYPSLEKSDIRALISPLFDTLTT